MFSCFAIELECYGCFWMYSILLFIYSFIYFWKLLLVHLMHTSMSLTPYQLSYSWGLLHGYSFLPRLECGSPEHLEDQTWIMFSIKKLPKT